MDPKTTPPSDDKQNDTNTLDSPQVSVDLQSVDAPPARPTAPGMPDDPAVTTPSTEGPSLGNMPTPGAPGINASAPTPGLPNEEPVTGPAQPGLDTPPAAAPVGMPPINPDGTGTPPQPDNALGPEAPAVPAMPPDHNPNDPNQVQAGLPNMAPVPAAHAQGNRILLMVVGLVVILVVSMVVAFVLA